MASSREFVHASGPASPLRVTPRCLRDLGWSRVVDALAARAATEVGRLASEGLAFLPDAGAIAACYAEVGELMGHLGAGGRLPLDGSQEIRGAVERAGRGAVLDIEQLLAITDTARAAARVRRHLLSFARGLDRPAHPRAARSQAEAPAPSGGPAEDEPGRREPVLVGIGATMPDLGPLAAELAATFDRTGQIRDDASPELAQARRRLAALHRQAKDRLEAYLARPDIQELCQDDYYTQREDRYVIPVIASFQAQVPGIIHGTSNTGQTVYLEPSEFIEINNAIKVAEAQVEVETRKVLLVRTGWVAAEADALREASATLVDLDLKQARAQLALDLDAHIPAVGLRGELSLRRARNPHLLLKGAAVVANDILLAPDQAFLVITGPNTGGKTVTLSTVGTCALMVRAGVPIPADPDSVMPSFDGLFALVGDMQDIERDLSTFSGHLEAVREILDEAHEGALVLLDEIIVGTEPAAGAALAIAVLEALADRGARGLVTTHYERLKTLAFEDPRFANASVGIDRATGSPTFVLKVGEPGASSPLEIAGRLGMSPAILARARALAGGDEGIAEAVRRLDEARAEAEDARRQAEQARREAERRVETLEAERERLRERAREEIAALEAEARRRAEEAIEALRVRTAELQKVNDPRELQRRREEVVAIAEALPIAPEAPAVGRAGGDPPKGPYDGGALPSDQVVPGATVWVRPLGQVGQVAEVHGRRAVVAVGAFRSTLDLGELGRVGGRRPSTPPRPSPSPAVQVVAERSTPMEITDDDPAVPAPRNDLNSVDLRGARRDEVVDAVEPLLDRAFREELGAVWIIHGHGGGVLREEVRQIVRRSPYVTKWRPGQRHEGGDGVTIAWLARP